MPSQISSLDAVLDSLFSVDAQHLQSVLTNLVVIADAAIPSGGGLTIFSELRDVADDAFEPPFDVAPGLYLAIGVTDIGIGMSQAVARRWITPFFITPDPSKRGGLDQCFGFARQSGDTLAVRSVEGQGTTVAILLPVTRDAAVADEPQRTVLLVEADPAIRELAADLLRSLGNVVIETEDAAAAIARLRHDLSIDLLSADIMMPNGVNGLELLVRAREIRPGLPAVPSLNAPAGGAPESTPHTSRSVPRPPYRLDDLRTSLRDDLAAPRY